MLDDNSPEQNVLNSLEKTMKNPLPTLALYTATILISALPFATDAAELVDKSKRLNPATTKTQVNKDLRKNGNSEQFLDVSLLKSRFDR